VPVITTTVNNKAENGFLRFINNSRYDR